MTTCTATPLAERLEDVSRGARRLWRAEPAATDRKRTQLLLELHAVRFELEDLCRAIHDRPADVDDERRLDACEARLAEIARWWP